jgi:hypothetical protein
MKRLPRLQFLLIAGIAGMASAPQASMLRAMSLAELVTAADQIVVAKVVSVNAAWDPAHRKILSSIEVEIEESWKGAANGFVTIVQPGGTVGEIEMTVHGMPKFTVGDRSLLFLQGRARFQVVGMSQGERPLSWDANNQGWWNLPMSPMSPRWAPTEKFVEPGPRRKSRWMHFATRCAIGCQ